MHFHMVAVIVENAVPADQHVHDGLQAGDDLQPCEPAHCAEIFVLVLFLYETDYLFYKTAHKK